MDTNEPIKIEIPEVVLFVLLYLGKRKNRQAKFSQIVFDINGIDSTIGEIKQDIYFSSFIDTYYNMINETDNSFTLKLTKSGINILPSIEYDKQVRRYNFFIKLTIIFYRVDKSIAKFIRKYIIKKKSPMEIFLRVISWIMLAIISALIGIGISEITGI